MVRSSKVTVSVRSRVAHVDLIHAISDRIAALVGFTGDDLMNLGLAVREATINAMKHGNGMDARKTVRVVFDFDDEGLSVSIRDRGHGFDVEDLPDPTLPENLFRPTGRGVLLMRAFVDRVDVRRNGSKGTEVCLFKHVPEAKTRRHGE